jgi:addiction module RelE/StbE family toxin
MTYSVVIHPQADRDIEEAFVYIALDNLEAGNAFLEAIRQSNDHLSEFPFSGAETAFSNRRLQNIRVWPVSKYKKYLVFYTVTEDSVQIIRVLHSARYIPPLFDE